jgi:hypothetical protein
MKAIGIRRENGVAFDKNKFESCIENLNTAQLQCENLSKEAETMAIIFQNRHHCKPSWSIISIKLGNIEHWLNCVLGEFEKKRFIKSDDANLVFDLNSYTAKFQESGGEDAERAIFKVADEVRSELMQLAAGFD